MGITSTDLHAAFNRITQAAQAARDELCEADGRIGDGDLGLTVADGFAACAALDLPADVGQALFQASKAFQQASSSSFGTLVATGLMAAAKVLRGRESFSTSEVADLLAVARDAMLERGKASLGDKTVLDTLDAQVQALAGADKNHAALAVQVAYDVLTRFRPLQNKAGRARIFAEQTLGQDDPGQLAMLRITEGLAGR